MSENVILIILKLCEDNIFSLSLVTLPISSTKDSLSLSSRRKEVLIVENSKQEHGSIRRFFKEDKILLLGCDWLADIPSIKLTANERRGKKRKQSGDIESDSVETKKMWGLVQ